MEGGSALLTINFSFKSAVSGVAGMTTFSESAHGQSFSLQCPVVLSITRCPVDDGNIG